MITEEVLEKLEFQKILQFIARHAYTDPGKELILNTRPFASSSEATTSGTYVSEAKEILIKNDVPPISYLPDLSGALSRSTIEGAVLDSKTILNILSLAETSRKVYQFLKSQDGHYELTSHYQNYLYVDKVLEHHISKVIDENGEVRDTASQKLREIRDEIRRKTDSLGRVINRILKELSDSYLVREEYITQRDGRMVVPVKAEHKRHVKGFIHSESSSGQTVYIEPEETLELNNDLLSLGFAEKREIERILRELTKKIGDSSYGLKEALKAIAQLDAIFSKAKYSVEIIGAFPTINPYKPVNLIDARHPLLIRKLGRNSTVPLDLKMENFHVLLITGPNAGGKTVVLKTFGLLSVMVQSGIHIPASADSNMHFFSNILMDIGDQQSIEDDLSTFSSHLSNIKRILSEADENSLVLIDELGTGTDPAEGSALSIAILLRLNEKKAGVLATTHHGSLKLFANDQPGFQNASMEFDLANLSPTYKLRQGIPGSSYAFEVAGRIGFEQSFLLLARNYLDTNKMKVENFLADLESKSRSLEDKLKSSEVENARLKGLTNLYQSNIARLEQQKKDIIGKAKVQADEYLKDVNKRIEQAIRQIRETQAGTEAIREAKKQVSLLKEESRKLSQSLAPSTPQQSDAPESFSVGDYVSVRDSQLSGRIEDINHDKNKAIIVAGSVKVQVKISNLIHVKKREVERAAEYQSPASYSSASFSPRLDIRGRRPEEVEFEIVRFIDDAYTSGLSHIEILHGKGTGVLKKLVKELLDKHDAVKSYGYANIEAGGDGITIAELK